MELEERIDVIVQATELAQKTGALSLDDAVIAKQAVDALKEKKDLKDAFVILSKVVALGQKRGAYTLRDAYFVYLALDGLEDLLNESSTPDEQHKE